jgi:cytochrome c biogenesis protein CcdA
MMDYIISALLPAFWFGILTSISPCPLATNIAAISLIGRRVGNPASALVSGLLYAAGRMLAYMAVSIIVTASLLSVPQIARFLQEYINIAIGPLLIITGLILTGIIKFSFISGGGRLTDRARDYAGRNNYTGAFLIGIVFALSFCPVSAGLFFGSLIPLSLKHGSEAILPLIFGLGTALPVLAIAIVIAFAAHWVGRMFDLLSKFEKYSRKITGWIFILIGLYISYEYILSGIIS